MGPEELDRLRAGLELMALRALGDRDLAAEVAQETIARALSAQRAGRRITGGSVGAFVRGIARHVIVDTIRARARTAPLEHAPTESLTDASNPLALLVDAEAQERVRKALDDLSPDDRRILRLSFFDGLTPTEIASQSGEPSPRIRKRKSRALARLRQAFVAQTVRVTNPAANRPFNERNDVPREPRSESSPRSGGDVPCSERTPAQ